MSSNMWVRFIRSRNSSIQQTAVNRLHPRRLRKVQVAA